MTPSYGRKRRGNSLLVQVKEESDKAGLKLNIQKKKIMTSGPLSLLSCVQLFLTPRTAARQVSLSIKNSRACSNSCPSSWWCHLTISSSVVPFSSRLQSFPASGSFPMSHFFPSCGQSIGVSASASVLPMYIQGWFPLGLTGLVFLRSKGLLSLLQYHSSKASILLHSAFIMVQLSHPYMITGKNIL